MSKRFKVKPDQVLLIFVIHIYKEISNNCLKLYFVTQFNH